MKISSLINGIGILASTFVIVACENDYVPPHTSKNVLYSPFIRFDEPVVPIVDPTDPTSGAFSNILIDPGNSVESFEIFVSIVKEREREVLQRRSLKVIDEFPHELTITAQDVFEAYNGAVTYDDLTKGNKLLITSRATDASGKRFTTNEFNEDLLNIGQRQALDYTLLLTCPFELEEAVGQYLIETDGIGVSLDYNRPIEAIAGPEGNSIIFLNLYSHPEMYDIEVEVDLVTGEAIIYSQVAWLSNNFGAAFGEIRMYGDGYFFTCEGRVDLHARHSGAAADFGGYDLVLKKIE